VDDAGNRVKFRMNEMQEKFYASMHYWNLILKARQHGFTTLIDLIILDQAMFSSNISCGIIADTKGNAEKIFYNKIKYPYDNLPEQLKRRRKMEKDTSQELRFVNGSSIYVSNSARGGTLQILHVSEYGKICAEDIKKAKEIKSGSLNTLAPGTFCFIESTAEGDSGDFYEMVQTAIRDQRAGRKLTKKRFKLHFYPWFEKEGNVLDPDGVIIESRLQQYFDELKAKHGIELTNEQKAWYSETEAVQQEQMKKEHPSTPDEAFQASIDGTYFSRQFEKAYEEKRICAVPYVSTRPVDTWWDIGLDDSMAIWFSQDFGREIHLIDYFEDNSEGWEYYAQVLESKGYRYGRHSGPHDLKNRVHGAVVKTVRQVAREAGINFTNVVTRPQDKMTAINKVRNIFPRLYFDEVKCAVGISHLKKFKKKWNPRTGRFMEEPSKAGGHIHAADALQTLALAHSFEGNMGMVSVIPKRF